MEPRPSDKVYLVPDMVFSLWQPKYLTTKALKGLAKFGFFVVWLISVVSWLLPLTLISEEILRFYHQNTPRDKNLLNRKKI